MATQTDQVYGKIQALVKAKPELGSAAAEKLSEVIHELETLDVNEGSSAQKEGVGKLLHGFQKFKKDIYDKKPELTNQLKTGQWPQYMVIACADSRVDPAILLGFQPGDAFIIRNVANMVPPWEKEGYPSFGSAVEYAVHFLKVKHIIVIGHRKCGGIGALIQMTPDDGKYSTDFIERWMAIGKPARQEVKSATSPKEEVDAICKICEKESVKNSLKNLYSYPFVKDAVSQSKISLHGGYYDHLEGSFNTWDFSDK